MATDFGGLFQTPEQYQQALQQQAYDRAIAMEQAPWGTAQRVAANVAGYNVGGAIGRALGGEDPQLKLISQRNQIASQINMTDPASISQGVQMASQLGDVQLATALADRLKTLQESMTKQFQERASASKSLAEASQIGTTQQRLQDVTQQLMSQYNLSQAEAQAVASNPDLVKSYYTPKSAQGMKLLESGKYTPESVTKWQSGQGELEPIDKQTKTTSDFLAKAVELGFGANAKYGDYNQDQVAQVNKSLFDDQIKLAAAKAMSVRVGVDVKGEEAFAKGLGELDAKAVAAARDKRDNSLAALSSLKQLNLLNQNDLISGSFASGRVGATNLLASLGLASGKDVDKLATSENYQKVAGDVILSTLGGRLGAGFSNEDRKFIQSLVPQLENSALARKQLIEFMTKKNQDIVVETSRMEEYARKNKSLSGFVPTIPIVNLQGVSNKPVNQMTRQELLDEKARLTNK
jgi:hypothetical protein